MNQAPTQHTLPFTYGSYGYTKSSPGYGWFAFIMIIFHIKLYAPFFDVVFPPVLTGCDDHGGGDVGGRCGVAAGRSILQRQTHDKTQIQLDLCCVYAAADKTEYVFVYGLCINGKVLQNKLITKNV